MKNAGTEHIIIEFQQGSKKAFEQIYNQFFPQLLYFARKLVNDEEEAKDIVIETFLKLFNRHQYFESTINIRAFLYVTVRNSCFDHLRQDRRISLHKQHFAATEETEGDLRREQIMGETMEAIYKAIEDLPTQCKKIFKLHFYEGHKSAEIAEYLKISVSTVRNQKMRALQLLRLRLDDNQLAIIGILCISRTLVS